MTRKDPLETAKAILEGNKSSVIEMDEKEMKNERDSKDNLPVDLYPTIMVRVEGEIKDTLKGYNKNKILTELKNY